MAISLDASARHDLGRGASRRLRREQRIPAIIIGGGQPTVAVSVSEQKLILAALKDEFFKEALTLNLDGSALTVKLKEVQRHPVSGRIIHLDFQRA